VRALSVVLCLLSVGGGVRFDSNRAVVSSSASVVVEDLRFWIRFVGRRLEMHGEQAAGTTKEGSEGRGGEEREPTAGGEKLQ